MSGITGGGAAAAEPRPRISLLPGFAAALMGVCAAFAYRDVLGLGFTGVDALPLILSARLESWAELPGILVREYLSAYGGDAIAGSTGVRPVGSASFALDHALWALDPRGYHITDVALHALNTSLVLLLAWTVAPARRLSVGLVAAAAFTLHPIGTAAVPLMAARYDLFLCTFTLLTLIAVLRYAAAPSAVRLLAVLASGALALLSKETAVVLLPIVAVTAMWASLRGVRSRPLVLLVGGYGALVVIYILYRTLLLRGLGGYAMSVGDPVAAAVVMAQRLFLALLEPYPMAMPGAFWRLAARVLAAAFALGFAAFTVGAVAGFVARRRHAGRAVVGTQPAAAADQVALLCLWLCTFLGFYAIAYLLTGIFKELYLYSALGIWCTLFAFAAVALHDRLRTRRTVGLRPAALGGAAIVLGALAYAWVRHSAPAGGLRGWHAASEVAGRYLAALRVALGDVPPGATLLLASLPQEVECSTRLCVGSTYVFEDYTLDAWLRLHRPESRIRFVALTSLRLDADDRPPVSRWMPAGARVLSGVVDRAVITHPWQTDAARYAKVSLAGSPPGAARITIVSPAVFDGSHFLFDAFHAPPLIRLADEG